MEDTIQSRDGHIEMLQVQVEQLEAQVSKLQEQLGCVTNPRWGSRSEEEVEGPRRCLASIA